MSVFGTGRWGRNLTTLPADDLDLLDLDLVVAFLTSGKARSEVRIGKAISAANADKIRAVIAALRRLLDNANANSN
jgi:hypothetical protein